MIISDYFFWQVSHNQLNWTPGDFQRDLRVFDRMKHLESLAIQHNPFCFALADYDLHILKSIKAQFWTKLNPLASGEGLLF